jgi:hypothetical protein
MSRPSSVRPGAVFAAALALALGCAGPALAQPVGGPAGRARLTPAQWQKIFPEFRQLALQDRRARIAILQRGERCVAAAANTDALRACLRQERGATVKQRQEHQAATRSLFERNGLPVPEEAKGRRGKGGAGRGAGAV